LLSHQKNPDAKWEADATAVHSKLALFADFISALHGITPILEELALFLSGMNLLEIVGVSKLRRGANVEMSEGYAK
jgi:hypothetical protein